MNDRGVRGPEQASRAGLWKHHQHPMSSFIHSVDRLALLSDFAPCVGFEAEMSGAIARSSYEPSDPRSPQMAD